MTRPCSSFKARWHFALVLGEGILAATLFSCGSSPSGPSASPSFSISVSPQSLSVGTGQSATLALSVDALNGFNQAIEVSVSGLPTGVTSSPASPFSMTTGGQTVTLVVPSSANVGTSTVIFDGSNGSLESSAQVSISVTQGSSGPPDNKTSFVRTDDTPQAIVYDPVHKVIFASALDLNCVDVIPLATQTITQCIPVSGALGLSLSADGTKVLVGTQVGVVAWIDTNTLQVVKRDVVAQIPNPQFGAGFGYEHPPRLSRLQTAKFSYFRSRVAAPWAPSINQSLLLSGIQLPARLRYEPTLVVAVLSRQLPITQRFLSRVVAK